ncbi:hypothetical protein [Aquimarina brevivitae]|nr:hypothetical protein [Aquimarina brevivitae]
MDRKLIIYPKLIALLLILGVYFVKVKNRKLNYYYIVSMLIMVANDALILTGFDTYFTIITLLGSAYFILSTFAISNYIKKEDVKISKFYSFPILIGIILLGYLIYAITDLVLPYVLGSLWSLSIFVVSMVAFTICCFFIFVGDRYTGTFKLFIAASCCLVVNALIPVNYFVYYTKVFTLLINLFELVGFFLFTLFLVSATAKLPSKTTNQFI